MTERKSRRAVTLAGILVLAALACDESETVAPEGSTISLAASPATILLSGGIQANDVNILATLRNSIGVPLPGQDVRFTMTSGLLDPQAGTPVTTDDLGNALTILSLATQNTTITATSGKATAMLTLQTATCNISSIALSESQLTFDLCSDTFALTATVTDTAGDPCVGVLVGFKSTVTNLPDTDVALRFSPGSKTSDANGEVLTQVSLAGDCPDKCLGMDCNTSLQEIVASGGGIQSQTVSVNIAIQ